MGAIREARWECPSCGLEERGRYESCTGCGAARPPGVRFYLPDDALAVTDPSLLADANSGADWNCDHCTGANKNSVGGRLVTSCVHCGNGRDSRDPSLPVRHFSPGSAPASAQEARRLTRESAIENSRRREETRRHQPASRLPRDHQSSSALAGSVSQEGPEKQSQGTAPFAAFLLVIVPMLLVSFLVWSFAFARYDTTWTVTDHRWERSIAIEVFKTLDQEGWNPPGDARIGSSEVRIRSWRDVLDRYETRSRQVTRTVSDGSQQYVCGTQDMGNGYFKDRMCTRQLTRTIRETEHYQHPIYRKEPVHDTWHEWKVDRWVPDRTLRSAGRDQNPYWAETPAYHERLREGRRHERLFLILDGPEGERYEPAVSEAAWRGLKASDQVRITTDFWGREISSDMPVQLPDATN